MKLLLIDGNAFMHRAFHALPKTLRLPDGRLVNAVYGFAAFLINVLKTERPDYLAVTFDHAKKTVRHEEYADYKATRVAAPQEFYDQIPLIKELIASFQITALDLEGYESDDLIATLNQDAQRKGINEIIIYSGDHDLFQLIDEHTKVAYPLSGIKKVIYFDTAKFYEKYQLSPKQIIDYKALRGDPSDNIPGVKGIGAKTAIALLKEFGSLPNIYYNLEKITESIREKLKNDQNNASLSQKLATLIHNLPIRSKLDDLSIRNLTIDRAARELQKLQFGSLINRLRALEKDIANKENKQTSLF